MKRTIKRKKVGNDAIRITKGRFEYLLQVAVGGKSYNVTLDAFPTIEEAEAAMERLIQLKEGQGDD